MATKQPKKSVKKTKRRVAENTTNAISTDYVPGTAVIELLSRVASILEDMKNTMHRIECRIPYESSRFTPGFPDTIPPYMQDDYKRRRNMPEPIMCKAQRTPPSPFF